MDFVAQALGGQPSIRLVDAATRPGAAAICNELFSAATRWNKHAPVDLAYVDTADRFALAIRSPQPKECLAALLRYHEAFGGGLRWFVLRDGKIEPRTPPGGRVSRYGFRLWSLCRLAAQCGIVHTMPNALRDRTEADQSETGEALDE
jgi:hypothetical protein